MARPVSEDLRVRAVAAFRAGASCREVGDRFEIAPSSVVKWAQLERETGSLSPGKVGGHRPVKLAPHRDFILACIEETPNLTLEKLQAMLAGRNVRVCLSTIWLFLQAQGLSFKKNTSGE